MAERGAVIKYDQKKAPKTGTWSYMCPEVDKEKCIGCGTCVPFCPDVAITITNNQETRNKKNKKGIAQIDYEYCKGCGVCAEVCPQKAITMRKK